MLSKEELIEKLAPHYQAFLKTRTSESTAWTATLSQFDDLKYLLKPEEDLAKKKLHGEVKHLIKEQERKEKEKLTRPIEPQITETNKSNLTTLKGSLGIEKSQPPEPVDEEFLEPRTIIYHKTPVEKLPEEQHEPEEIITREIHTQEQSETAHEPDQHSDSFLDDETKYISRTSVRERLRKEHKKEIERRTGLKMR